MIRRETKSVTREPANKRKEKLKNQPKTIVPKATRIIVLPKVCDCISQFSEFLGRVKVRDTIASCLVVGRGSLCGLSVSLLGSVDSGESGLGVMAIAGLQVIFILLNYGVVPVLKLP